MSPVEILRGFPTVQLDKNAQGRITRIINPIQGRDDLNADSFHLTEFSEKQAQACAVLLLNQDNIPKISKLLEQYSELLQLNDQMVDVLKKQLCPPIRSRR